MVEAKPELEHEQGKVSITIEECYAKVIEVHKARLTLHLGLAFAIVTLTGYAIQQRRFPLFVIGAALPVIAFGFDLLVKYRFATPFLYKAASLDLESRDSEPMSLLFLDYGNTDDSKYREIFKLPTCAERQRGFRTAYVRESLSLKILLFGSAATVELILGLLFR